MGHPVFISYARGASKAHAQALKARLGDLAFLDLHDIDDGEQFPPRLLHGLLDAHIVVVFATNVYAERRFCRLELRLALAAGGSSGSHIVVALGEQPGTILDGLPACLANESWPQADASDRIESLVRNRLAANPAPLREALSAAGAQRIAASFLENSSIPEPQSLHGLVVSLPPGVALESIGSRFVGRFDDLRRIHAILCEGCGGRAQLTSRIAAGAGFGKTRLAAEYLHRYAQHYPSGLFWINAAASSIEDEFWRILHTLNPEVPSLPDMRKSGRNVRAELENAFRQIKQPALCVVDNIPEAAQGASPSSIADFCPGIGSLSVLATSRQDTREPGVTPISIGELKSDAAVLLLTEGVPGASKVSWSDWERIAAWVGHLPLALDLLNRSLALDAVSITELLKRVQSPADSSGATAHLDRLSEALREQVPAGAARGITEAFLISFEQLSNPAKNVAALIAQLAPAPVPEAFMEMLPPVANSPSVRAALRSRHFVTSVGDNSFGVMHRLTADFIRTYAGNMALGHLVGACQMVLKVMTLNACNDPRQWPVIDLFLPHAEYLFDRVAANSAFIPLTAQLCVISNLALLRGDYSSARRIAERFLKASTEVVGNDHPLTLTAKTTLAAVFHAQGDYSGARPLQEQVLRAWRQQLPENHPLILSAMNMLAATLRAQGDLAEAYRLQNEAFIAQLNASGLNDPAISAAQSDLARTYTAQGNRSQALQYNLLAFMGKVREKGIDDLNTLESMNAMGESLLASGFVDGTRHLFEDVRNRLTRLVGEDNPATLRARNNLAVVLGREGNLAEARRMFEEVLEIRERLMGADNPQTLTTRNNLARILFDQGDFDAARLLEQQTFENARRVLGTESPDTLTYMAVLGEILIQCGEHDRAASLLRECLALHNKVLGEKHPETIIVRQLFEGLGADGAAATV